MLKRVTVSSPQSKKASKRWPFFNNGSGGWIRTNDLRVMSPTSYQTAPPRIKLVVFRGCPRSTWSALYGVTSCLSKKISVIT